MKTKIVLFALSLLSFSCTSPSPEIQEQAVLTPAQSSVESPAPEDLPSPETQEQAADIFSELDVEWEANVAARLDFDLNSAPEGVRALLIKANLCSTEEVMGRCSIADYNALSMTDSLGYSNVGVKTTGLAQYADRSTEGREPLYMRCSTEEIKPCEPISE